MNGPDADVLAVGKMYPLERCPGMESIDGLIGDVGDLQAETISDVSSARSGNTTHPNETDALEARQIGGELEDGHVGQLLAVCGSERSARV